MIDRRYCLTLSDFHKLFVQELKSNWSWAISYHDKKHLQKAQFVELGHVDLAFDPTHADKAIEAGHTLSPSFSFSGKKTIDLQIELQQKAINSKSTENDEPISEQLWESFHRLSMRSMGFESEDLDKLASCEFAILVLDTSALRLGVGSYLVDLLVHGSIPKSVWIIIPLQVILEIENNVEYLKGNQSDKKTDTLKKRPLATLAPYEINRLKQNRVPVEFLRGAPELIQKEVLKDRRRQYVKFCVKSRSRVGSALVLHFDPIESHAANHGIEQ